MRTGIVHARVVCDQDRMLEDGAVIVEQGRITAVLEADAVRPDMADCFLDARGLTLTPGWIDIHIHGAGGRDLIEGTAEAVRAVSENVIRDGCTSFIASLTVVSHPQMLSILENLAGCGMDQPGASLLGIHSEGPYLSVQYKALMNEQWLRDPSLEELRQMCEAAQGHLKLMTVAPERPGMPELIEAAVAEGITVMIGHTAATSAQVHQARLCGAAGFTHLYNAMSQHLHRQPGCVTGAFLEKAMAAELIADGFHVDPEVVRVTWQHFGSSRLVLITDAMLGKGMPDGCFEFSGLLCRKKGQHVRVVETGRRAGSAIGMNDAVRMMQQMCGCTPCQLVEMAAVNPARLIGVSNSKGRILPGMDADLALFDQQWNCHAAWVRGECRWKSEDCGF